MLSCWDPDQGDHQLAQGPSASSRRRRMRCLGHTILEAFSGSCTQTPHPLSARNKAYLASRYLLSVAPKEGRQPKGRREHTILREGFIRWPTFKSLYSHCILFHFLNLDKDSIPLEQIPETFPPETEKHEGSKGMYP